MITVRQCVAMLGLACLVSAASASGVDTDPLAEWRVAAAHTLGARNDSESLATAAALTYVGTPARSKVDAGKAAGAAVELLTKASELAPDNRAITWLRLHLCAHAPGCDIREAATTMRWVDADNAAAWLPTLASAQKDRDTVQVDRILADMAQGTRFDLYGDRFAVMVFDALKRVRLALPPHYAASDLTRLTEAMGIANAAIMPSFSPLLNACRETTAAERRDACLKLSRTMQKADTVLTQLVGFALDKRLTPGDLHEQHSIAERRRRLEWQVSSANISDTPLLPWLRNARARSRLATMRALNREEDVCVALLRDHGMPLEPPEESR